MNLLWISLPAAWKLQDIQAALNVIISILSALCIFIFARICWQTATAQVAKNKNVPIAGLLSVNTVGEVYDVCRLLGVEILSSYYLRILAQCVVVTGLTVAAFLSGPIARFSTSMGHKAVTRDVHGLMANQLHGGISHEAVLWNDTWTSLDRADFPRNQILDYLPPSTVHWQYLATQWNSSWSMSCDKTEVTPIDLYIVNENCTTMNTAIPAMANIFEETTYVDNSTWSTYQDNWESLTNARNITTDALLFRFGFIDTDYNDDTKTYETLQVTMLAAHLQDLPTQMDRNSYCDFGTGKVSEASYTKAVCHIKKTRHTTVDNDRAMGAYPDHGSLDFVPMAYTSYFQARFNREINAGNVTTVITPDDLIRFYQVYLITKDTQSPYKVTRPMEIDVRLVRLSTIFLVICGISLALCIFGIFHYGIFSVRHNRTINRTPQSKLDWMLQSIEGRRASMTSLSGRQSRHSIASMTSPDIGLGSPTSARKRSDFETATYGLSSPDLATPYHSNWLSRQISGGSDGSGYFPMQPIPFEDREASDVSLLARYHSAPAQPPDSSYRPHVVPSTDYSVHR